MHLFYAHGGGLGHLTRIHKLIRTLKLPAHAVCIITPSAFTSYFTDYKFVKISWNTPVENWSKTIEETLIKHNTNTFYIDTFPLGIKGELLTIYKTFPKLKYVYISRILKWQDYYNSMPLGCPITFSKTIILEELYPEHLYWIQKNTLDIEFVTLQNDRFPAIPFLKSPYLLVVHSGGKKAVLQICNEALKVCQNRPEIAIIVFTQVDVDLKDPRIQIFKNKYPVSRYFKHAEKIYTAAGFNSMQELNLYKEKHIAIPLDKLYDDQFFRYAKMTKNYFI